MKKKIAVLLFLSLNILLFSESDFEQNFLQTYINVEQFFLKLGGDYGTTFFPFLNNGYGGRELGFSGAFTAIADDVCTLESNPAGTASIENTQLYFSHIKLLGDVNYNTLAYTMRLNDLGLGIGTRLLYIPFTHYDKFGYDIGNGMITYTVITLNASYNFLRSYEFFGLSLGMNAKFYIYGVPDSIASNQTTVNAIFDFGLLTRFNFLKGYKTSEKNFSFGLTLKNIGPFTNGEPPPTTVAAGLSYKPIEQIIMSADFNYLINYSAETYKNWSVHSGFEWFFTKNASILAGFTVKSNPSFSLGFNFDFEDFTLTAIYNPDFTDVARFSVSASLKLGDLGRAKQSEIIRKMYAQALRMVNDGDYEEANTALEIILQKDPGFTPAKKTLKNVKKQLETQKSLDEIIKEQQNLKF
jgi:hypothetical protein